MVCHAEENWRLIRGEIGMEKIKQALERARQERNRDQPAEPAKPTQSGEYGVEQKISYSKTRVVEIDPEVLRRNRIVLGNENEVAASAYKILRTQVQQRLAANNWNSIAITSPGRGHGKTLTAINLSIALAREVDRTVLLVDLDLRNPSVHRRFEQSIDRGLVDYLLDDVPLMDILMNPGIEKLVVLPAGRAVPNSSELLSSPKMVRLVEELKSRYPARIIVYDLPPLLSADGTLAFSPYVDATLMVVEDGKTTKDELTAAVEMMEGAPLIGTVLNKVSESQLQYSYY